MKTFQKILFILALLIGLSFSGEAKNRKVAGPLLDGLGDLHFPISTKSKLAQRYFDQGLILSYAFNHKEAIRSFQSVTMLDPNCAMGFWGIANASGPHVNKPMDTDDNAQAWRALQQAIALSINATAKEQAMIEALSKRYQEKFQEDRSGLDKDYAEAMRDLIKKFPDDLDLQTMFAESLMDTTPWDYWLKDRSPKPATEEALRALKFVLSRNPDHPGANHFYIHAVEAGPTPEAGLPSADRLRNFAPHAGHLVHMPSHIYIRTGQFSDAILANEKAVKADREYLRQTRAQGFYPGVYYPHNIHFLWWALMFEGRSKESMKRANEAALYAVENYCGPKKVLEAPRFRHLPWLTMLRFGKMEKILDVPRPAATNDFLIDRAVWHFARGLAFVSQTDAAEAAMKEQTALAEIADSDEAKKLDSPGFPVSSVLAVAKHWLAGRVAESQGNPETAVRELTKAVEIEDAIPYMEPAYWPLNVRPALGAVLLRDGNPKRAEEIFREDLKHLPRNGWGLLGLETSLRAQNRNEAADVVQRQFKETWKNADTKLDVSWF
jgi:tetratricopeptide (TPR) repeat protein